MTNMLEVQTVSDFIKKDGVSTQFCIPIFQRNYKWDEANIKSFIEDLEADFEYSKNTKYKGNSFNLGIFYTDRNIGRSKTLDRLKIIDGQQRMTTLILLIECLQSFLPAGTEQIELFDIDKLRFPLFAENKNLNDNYRKLFLTSERVAAFAQQNQMEFIDFLEHKIKTDSKWLGTDVRKPTKSKIMKYFASVDLPDSIKNMAFTLFFLEQSDHIDDQINDCKEFITEIIELEIEDLDSYLDILDDNKDKMAKGKAKEINLHAQFGNIRKELRNRELDNGEFLYFILKELTIIEYKVSDTREMHKLFEKLNNRGTKLNTIEIYKNLLYNEIQENKDKDHSSHTKFLTKWSKNIVTITDKVFKTSEDERENFINNAIPFFIDAYDNVSFLPSKTREIVEHLHRNNFANFDLSNNYESNEEKVINHRKRFDISYEDGLFERSKKYNNKMIKFLNNYATYTNLKNLDPVKQTYEEKQFIFGLQCTINQTSNSQKWKGKFDLEIKKITPLIIRAHTEDKTFIVPDLIKAAMFKTIEHQFEQLRVQNSAQFPVDSLCYDLLYDIVDKTIIDDLSESAYLNLRNEKLFKVNKDVNTKAYDYCIYKEMWSLDDQRVILESIFQNQEWLVNTNSLTTQLKTNQNHIKILQKIFKCSVIITQVNNNEFMKKTDDKYDWDEKEIKKLINEAVFLDDFVEDITLPFFY